MVSERYACAYKEVIEVLKHTKRADVNKIPKYKVILWKANMKKDYDFKLQEKKSLEEQGILNETKAIIANIYKEYWATEEDKEKILQKEKAELQKLDDLKCSGEDLFKNKEEVEENIDNNVQELGITVVETKWYDKVFSFFKRIFKK